jgi:hypothetical protein
MVLWILQFTICNLKSVLPAGFDDAGQLACEGMLAEADAAHAELAYKRARATTEFAAVVRPHPELGCAVRLYYHGLLSHFLSS